MRTIETTIYEFNELSEKAQRRAIDKFIENDYIDFSEENKSLEKFCELFGLSYREHSHYDSSYFTFNFDNSDLEDLKGIKLSTYLWNNYKTSLFKNKIYFSHKPNSFKKRTSKIILDNCCVLTGVYSDDDILNPIYTFLKRPDIETTFNTLIDKCFKSYVKMIDNIREYHLSDEYVKEQLENCEYEFDENGNSCTYC